MEALSCGYRIATRQQRNRQRQQTRHRRCQELPGEGFKRPWPPLSKMDEAVKAKVEKLFKRWSHKSEIPVDLLAGCVHIHY
jgi:hypothetical protein